MTFQTMNAVDVASRRRITRRIATVAAASMLALFVTATHAQTQYAPGLPVRGPGARYRHASTIAQGNLDGWANVYRGIGQARYNSALAARHAHAAYEHQIMNRRLRVESYYEAKRCRRKYLVEHAPSKTTMASRVRQAGLPDRLTQKEYDRMSGRIYWADALLNPQFASHRQLLEGLFDQRTLTRLGKGSSNTAHVDRTIKGMKEILGQCVRADVIGPHEFIVANRFLDGLRREGHYPSQRMALSRR